MAVDAYVERLAKLDTCAVSDAQDKLGIKGTVIGISPLYPTGRIAGRAVTVRLKSKGDREESKVQLCTTAVVAADVLTPSPAPSLLSALALELDKVATASPAPAPGPGPAASPVLASAPVPQVPLVSALFGPDTSCTCAVMLR